MSKSLPTSLLTKEDLTLMRSEGVPYAPREEHCDRFMVDDLHLTPRGVAFYRAACEHYGVDASSIETISTPDELSEVVLAIKRVIHGLPESGFPVFQGDHYEPRRRVPRNAKLAAKGKERAESVVYVDFRDRTRRAGCASA